MGELAITKKEKRAYLKSPFHCPFCNSTNISSGHTDNEGKVIIQPVECFDCKCTWNEVFVLIDIIDDEKKRIS